MAVKKPTPEVEPIVQLEPTPASTFAERKAARLKAVQSAENKSVKRAETK